MVHPDPGSRPSSTRLLANSSLNPSMNKSRSQLYKELREAKEKVALLENIIVNTPRDTAQKSLTHNKENNEPGPKMAKRLIGRGTAKSNSCLL